MLRSRSRENSSDRTCSDQKSYDFCFIENQSQSAHRLECADSTSMPDQLRRRRGRQGVRREDGGRVRLQAAGGAV